MKKLISIFSIVLLLQACATTSQQYSKYDDVYYEDDYYYDDDYYADDYNYDDNYQNDYYANNYYPDRWGINYSNVYYSPYRYPRVGFYNYYAQNPYSYWGSYSPWGHTLGYNSYGWNYGSSFLFSNSWRHNHNYYNDYYSYNPYRSSYYNSYWNNYWNRYQTNNHISARSEVARLAARNHGFNRTNRYSEQANNNNNRHTNNTNVATPNRIRANARGRTTNGFSSNRRPNNSIPFTGYSRNNSTRAGIRNNTRAQNGRINTNNSRRTHAQLQSIRNSNGRIVSGIKTNYGSVNRNNSTRVSSNNNNGRFKPQADRYSVNKPQVRRQQYTQQRQVIRNSPSRANQQISSQKPRTYSRPAGPSSRNINVSQPAPSNNTRPTNRTYAQQATVSRPANRPNSNSNRSSNRSSNTSSSNRSNSRSSSSSHTPSRSSGRRSSGGARSELRNRR